MTGQKNLRVVLPQSSCPPQRRVIAPTGFSKNGTNTSLHTVSSSEDARNIHSSRSSMQPKHALSTKEYKEYLEDMELKIRYMKNDIEFKQSQMQGKEVAPRETPSSVSSGPRLRQPPVHRNQAFSSSSVAARPVKTASSFGHTSNPQSHHHVPSRFSYVKKHCDESNIVTTASLPPSKSVSVPANYSTHQSFSQFTTSKPTQVSSSLQMHSSTQESSLLLQGQTSNLSVTMTTGDSQPFSEALATASVFQRLGGFLPHSSTKPIYVSPTKNQAIWSQSTNRTVLRPSGKPMQPFPVLAGSNKEEVTPAASHQDTNLHQPVSLSTGAATAVSRYRLVKTSAPSVAEAGANTSAQTTNAMITQPVQSSLEVLPSNQLLPSNQTPFNDHTARKTPKVKISAKVVSKYKMTRLSPNSVTKLAPQLWGGQAIVGSSSSPSQPSKDQSKSIHKLDRRTGQASLQPDSASKTPRYKGPKLQVVAAAKLVSKYKLKRLSPTSASKVAPLLFKNQSAKMHSGVKGQSSNKYHLDYRHTKASLYKSPKSKTPILNTQSHGIHTTPYRKSSHYLPQSHFNSKYHLRKSNLILDKRVKKSVTPHSKRRQSLSLKCVHKLDRRPKKSPTSSERVKFPAQIVQRRRSKLHWSNKMRETLPSTSAATIYRKHQPMRSRFKWTNSPTGGSKAFWWNGSHFKWSKHGFLAKPNPFMARRGLATSKDLRYSASATQRSNLVMIRGVVYRSNWNTQDSKTYDQVLRGSSQTNMKLITVRGAHKFHTDSGGKKLCRAGLENPVEKTAILAASRVVNRSIAVAAAKFRKNNTKWKEKKQHCIFFGRFGKCHRGDSCKYLHDPDKVAVCTRFLRGKCEEARCPFSHNASVHKMPVCLHFLQGECSRDSCPYLHVRVNPSAPVCKDFHSGYCPLGDKCKKLHSLVCPTFAVTGECSRGEACTLLHRRIKRQPARQDSGRNIRQRSRKRRKSSAADARASKKQATAAATTSSTGEEQQSSQTSTCHNPSHVDHSAPLGGSQGQSEGSTATLNSSKVSATVDTATPAVQPQPPILTAVTSSPVKGSAPLQSQPSFISLSTDSPVPPPSQTLSSRSGSGGGLTQAPHIRPLFISQRLSEAERTRDKVKVAEDSEPAPDCLSLSSGSEKKEAKSAPRPAFLLNHIHKADSK